MRLCLVNPDNPFVSLNKVDWNRLNKYRIWKPLSHLVLSMPPEPPPPDRGPDRERERDRGRSLGACRIRCAGGERRRRRPASEPALPNRVRRLSARRDRFPGRRCARQLPGPRPEGIGGRSPESAVPWRGPAPGPAQAGERRDARAASLARRRPARSLPRLSAGRVPRSGCLASHSGRAPGQGRVSGRKILQIAEARASQA